MCPLLHVCVHVELGIILQLYVYYREVPLKSFPMMLYKLAIAYIFCVVYFIIIIYASISIFIWVSLINYLFISKDFPCTIDFLLAFHVLLIMSNVPSACLHLPCWVLHSHWNYKPYDLFFV